MGAASTAINAAMGATSPWLTYGLPIASGLLGSLGGLLGSDPNKKQRKYAQGRLRSLEGGLENPMGMGDIASAAPMIRRAMMPYINKFASGAAAKYGSTSGATAGAIGANLNETMAPQLSQLYQMMLNQRLAGRQTLAGIYGQQAMAQ